jgi:hypothetical protein
MHLKWYCGLNSAFADGAGAHNPELETRVMTGMPAQCARAASRLPPAEGQKRTSQAADRAQPCLQGDT